MLLTRELKSVALIVLVMLVAGANAAPKDKPKILVPLNVKSTYFVYQNSKPIKKYVEARISSEIKQSNKDKRKLKGRARKQAVLRITKLKRELRALQKNNTLPDSIRKTVIESGVGFVDMGKNHRWVRIVRIINDREFIATIGHQSFTARITSRNYGRAITSQNFAGFTRRNIEGTIHFRFIGFDTSHVRENKVYRLMGFFKTTTKTIEPFVPDN